MRKTRASSHFESDHTGASPYWSRPTEEIFVALDSYAGGMTRKEAVERLADTGPNSLETRKGSTPFGLFLNQFKSPSILVLLAATIISTFVHDWADALIILTIILGSAILILAIVEIHFVSAELTKRWFYRQVRNHG